MNKLDECYVISREIINKYIELMCLPMYMISNDMKQNKINEIKVLVNEEYKIIHSMSSVEVKLCLEKINTSEDEYDKIVLTRIRNRIEDYDEVLKGNYITTNELGIKNIPQDKDYSSYDVALSILNIETIKRMKNKIYALTPTCDKDKRFTSNLKRQLEMSRINFLFSSLTSELITLYNTIDIENIPNINIDKLKNSTIRNIDFNRVLANTSLVYTKKVLDILSSIPVVNNNPDDVFDYLSLTTRLEVLISYMDKNTLKTIYDYCKSRANIINKSNMEYVKKLIKRKIEENN